MSALRRRPAQLALMLAMPLLLVGCASWGPSASDKLPLFDASATGRQAQPQATPTLPSTRVKPTLDRNSILRYQSPDPAAGSLYGSPYGTASTGPTNDYAADGSGHFRYPMAAAQPSSTAVPHQLPPTQPAGTAYPATAVASSTYAPQAASPIGTQPSTGYASPAQAFGPPPGPTPNYIPPGTVPPPVAQPGTTTLPPGAATLPPGTAVAPPAGTAIPPQWQNAPPPSTIAPPFGAPGLGTVDPAAPPLPLTDVIVNVQETQTGRLMFGAAVNSDAGVTGQIVLDEKNFDWRRFPTSLDDFVNGRAFRGDGQGFRVEAMPGSEVQRYLVSFTEPYFLDTRVSFQLSGFLYDRNFFDWDEQRYGGNIGFGYRITPDLSVNASMRLQNVEISDPRVLGVPELDAALGDHDLFGARFSLTQDTRDIPFAPTQGYYVELAFEQVFGSFDYSRGTADFRRFFLLTERPDGSGRHVLSFANRIGITGSQTPVFENFFAGGVGTLRGFDFRGASPLSGGVTVGGELSFLGSVEYRFPITADDMIQGAVFCDYGTIEEELKINTDDYRVALGLGLRINVPAMGPAPIAIDFAVPIAREDTDDIRQFSFFVGGGRF